MTQTPLYLESPVVTGHTYGRLRFNDGGYSIYDAVPVVLEMAKRVFPGCKAHRRSNEVHFRATRRAIGDLNWLMTRYPLVIDDADRYEEHRLQAIRHALRRDRNNEQQAPATPPPTFDGQLYSFQAQGVTFLTQNDRTLLADDMGLGKTVTALASLAMIDAFPALIVVPPNVRGQWQDSAGQFLNIVPEGELVRDRSGERLCEMLLGREPRKISDRPIAITSYNLLPYWQDVIIERGFKAIIFDEIQELRHIGTKKYSAASLISGAVDVCWGLSGTPIHNYGIEMWSVLNIIDYHCLGDRESFTREWCTGYGEKIVEKPEVLRDHLKREGLMLRRRKLDVMSELPPKHRVAHTIGHDADVYDNLITDARQLASRLPSIHGWHERGQAALQIEQDTRRATGIAKAPYAAEFAASLLAAGERPLIYAWHHDVHDELTDGLRSFRVGRVTGRETAKKKRDSIRAFKGGELDGMVMSLRATAGLDGLQSHATCVVFCELDWSPAIHSQCEDRLHRLGIGQLDKVMCYYLVSQTGYDGVVMDALGIKIGQFTGIMGDESETEDDRHIAKQKAREHLEQVCVKLREEAA